MATTTAICAIASPNTPGSTCKGRRRRKKSPGAKPKRRDAPRNPNDTAQITVAADLNNHASDYNELISIFDAIEAHTGSLSQEILAETVYKSKANFAALQEKTHSGLHSLRPRSLRPTHCLPPRSHPQKREPHRAHATSTQDPKGTGELPKTKIHRRTRHRLAQTSSWNPPTKPSRRSQCTRRMAPSMPIAWAPEYRKHLGKPFPTCPKTKNPPRPNKTQNKKRANMIQGQTPSVDVACVCLYVLAHCSFYVHRADSI